MLIDGFRTFGGTHWITAGLRSALAHAGVVAPHTGKPLSEAMCLGIMGGIAAGYSFCPSIPNSCTKLTPDVLKKLAMPTTVEDHYMRMFGFGSGASIIGLSQAYSTAGASHRDFFKRLGAKVDVRETASKNAAARNLTSAIEAGKPAYCWIAFLPQFGGLGWPGTCGMYTTLIVGLDEAKGQALASDCAPHAIAIPLDDLAWARGRICSFKNRTLTFDAPKKLDKATLSKAALDGIRACAGDFIKPKLGTFNLPGLLEWSTVIASDRNKKKGWPCVYRGGMLYHALRDTFSSIETAGTGGGLFRGMYADFLDEAAALTDRRALGDCAATYRALSKQWTALADALLPDSVKPCKQAKQLLRKRRKLYVDKGDKARAPIDKATDELRNITLAMVESFPLSDADRTALLGSLGERIKALHDAERAAADQLHAASQ